MAQINTWLDRIHVSLNDDLVPYIMDGIKVRPDRGACLMVYGWMHGWIDEGLGR